MQRPRDDIAVHGTQSAPAVRVAGEEQRVRELMVEALSAEDPEQHDVVGLRLQRVGDRELEVRLVLLRRERHDRDAQRTNDAQCVFVVAASLLVDCTGSRGTHVANAQSCDVGGRVPVERHLDERVVLAVGPVNRIQHQRAVF